MPRPPRAAPIALTSVSAYRFWLTFISTVPTSRSDGDFVSTMVRRSAVDRREPGRDVIEVDRLHPLTAMPRAIRPSLSDCAKKMVGLTTATVRSSGADARCDRAADLEHRLIEPAAVVDGRRRVRRRPWRRG